MPDQVLADAYALMDQHNISGIPVTEGRDGKLVGVLTNRDVRFASDPKQPVKELMTKRLVTVKEGVGQEEEEAARSTVSKNYWSLTEKIGVLGL